MTIDGNPYQSISSNLFILIINNQINKEDLCDLLLIVIAIDFQYQLVVIGIDWLFWASESLQRVTAHTVNSITLITQTTFFKT